MKLKNDIQIKAFLIRNKIAFERWDTYLLIDEEKVDSQHIKLLREYEYQERPTRKRAYTRGVKTYYSKKPSVQELLKLSPEPQPERKERPAAEYSNPKFNS